MEEDWKFLSNGTNYKLFARIILKLFQRLFELALTYFTVAFSSATSQRALQVCVGNGNVADIPQTHPRGSSPPNTKPTK